jgi:hypothetical protein
MALKLCGVLFADDLVGQPISIRISCYFPDNHILVLLRCLLDREIKLGLKKKKTTLRTNTYWKTVNLSYNIV